jgi:wobble nucleotide-excising tRNase
MIHKIIHIKNLGKYKEYKSTDSNWNGILNKNTAIYAENGSGKTTLSQLFKSLKDENSLLLKRKSFSATDDIDISLLDEEKKPIQYRKNKWNINKNDIEIFDTFFIEDNVYIISIGNYDREGNLFEIVMGDEARSLYDKIVVLTKERKKEGITKRRYKYKISSLNKKNDPRDAVNIKKYKSLYDKKEKKLVDLKEEIDKAEKQLFNYAEDFGKTYLAKINEFLRYFNPNIQLTKLNKKGTNFVYYLKINNHEVRSDSETISLKHTLSEGDKSSLALSFFLARISLKTDLSQKFVVFDDPISSFDYNRRHVTINLLNTISKKVNQFLLLSHDLNFVKDFSEKVNDCLNLKIVNNGKSSVIINHNIKYETLTGIYKDLTVVDNYIKNGESSEFDKREVIRCIRPIIEGFFRIKFFNYLDDSAWLGDIISEIRNCENDGLFYKYKINLEDLIDINDYSKIYHHSNPNYLEVPINAEELTNYSKRTLELLRSI